MKRRLFTILSTLSLLLCVAMVVLWVRSYWIGETWYLRPSGPVTTVTFFRGMPNQWQVQYSLESARGSVQLVRRDMTTGDHAAPGRATSDPPGLTRMAIGRDPQVRSWTFAGFYVYDAPKRPLATGGMQAQLWGFRIVGVPYWALAVASAVPPSLWVINRRRYQREPGHCHRCGYDLRATPDRCPECGALPHAVGYNPPRSLTPGQSPAHGEP